MCGTCPDPAIKRRPASEPGGTRGFRVPLAHMGLGCTCSLRGCVQTGRCTCAVMHEHHAWCGHGASRPAGCWPGTDTPHATQTGQRGQPGLRGTRQAPFGHAPPGADREQTRRTRRKPGGGARPTGAPGAAPGSRFGHAPVNTYRLYTLHVHCAYYEQIKCPIHHHQILHRQPSGTPPLLSGHMVPSHTLSGSVPTLPAMWAGNLPYLLPSWSAL